MTILVNRVPTIISTLIWVGLAAVVAVGEKQFVLWRQMTLLRGTDPWQLLLKMHPHSSRYLLIDPIYVLSDATGVDADRIFSFICIAMMFIVFLTILYIDRKITKSSSLWFAVALSAILVGLALAMNGRGSLVLAGYSVLIASFVAAMTSRRLQWWLLVSPFVGLMLCSLSSGVLAIAYAFLAAGAAVSLLRQREAVRSFNITIVTIGAGIAGVVMAPILWLSMAMTFSYFGNGPGAIWEMLGHGLGEIAIRSHPLMLIIAIPIVLIVASLAIWAARKASPSEVIAGIAALLALAGGMFGFTTLSVIITPALAMVRSVVMIAFRRRIKGGLKNCF